MIIKTRCIHLTFFVNLCISGFCLYKIEEKDVQFPTSETSSRKVHARGIKRIKMEISETGKILQFSNVLIELRLIT